MILIDSKNQLDELIKTTSALKHEKKILKDENAVLKRLLHEFRYHERTGTEYEEVESPTGEIAPQRVLEWMAEYKMPCEIFWCDEHSKWHDQLDNSFPYYLDNKCEDCD